jgi:hypothetical protein
MELDRTRYLTPQNTARSEREDIINEFVTRLNNERIGTKYKPITPRAIAVLINRHPNLKSKSSLYEFLSLCKQAKHFSKYFWWIVKPKDH